MTCRQFHQEVDSLVRGELPHAEQEALQAHATMCPDCSELWEDERRLQQGIMAQNIPAPNDDFESRVRALALSGGAPSGSRLPKTPIWATSIAAVLALGIFIGTQIGPVDVGQAVDDMAETSGHTTGPPAENA